MKTPDPLQPLLASWEHSPSHASDFNAGVWARLHSGERGVPPFSPIIRFPWLLPLAASVTVLLSVAAGTGSALALNQAQAAERMASAYVRSIDPVQMSAAHDHPHTSS